MLGGIARCHGRACGTQRYGVVSRQRASAQVTNRGFVRDRRELFEPR